jgi:integrase
LAGRELTVATSKKSHLKYVYNQPNHHGRTRYYFWRGKPGFRKYRVKDDIITGGEFHQAYGRFLDGLHPYPDLETAEKANQPAKKPAHLIAGSYPHGSWGWLCQEYVRDFAFRRLKNRRVIQQYLEKTWKEPCDRKRPEGKTYGEMPVARLRTLEIQTLAVRWLDEKEVQEVDRRTGQVAKVTKIVGKSAHNNLLKYMSGVFEFGKTIRAVERNWVREVPKQKTKGGFAMWTDEVWDRMENFYPLGTKERLTFDLAAYSGQRKGDVVFLGWRQFRADPDCPLGVLEVVQEKGDDEDPVTAYVPIVPELHLSLKAAEAKGILGSEYFIRQNHKDEPYTKESLGNRVRKWLNRAGIPNGYSLHGLRKLCVCRLIERGCTHHEVMSITGHQTLKEIDRYAKQYFRARNKEHVLKKWVAGVPVKPAKVA